jgi:dihydropteroate synthase
LAAEIVADGQARLLAGGPFAMTACEVRIRSGEGVRSIFLSLADLLPWLRRNDAPQRLRDVLGRIEAPRPGAPGQPQIMGILNVTPDSFSDGGQHLDPAAAVAHCEALASSGADIIDIGGESTRPGATPVTVEEESARVMPVLEGLRAIRDRFPGVALSIDTRHAAVMRTALAAGVDIINDVTALTGEADSLQVAAASKARIVLMHMQGTPETMNIAPTYEDVALDVFDFLEARIEACVAAGIERGRLIVDPGIGFGKRGNENLEILRALPLFHGLGCPILLGLSRKGLGVSQASIPPEQRLPLSLAGAAHALSAGAQMLRVHDVAAARQVVDIWRQMVAFGA